MLESDRPLAGMSHTARRPIGRSAARAASPGRSFALFVVLAFAITWAVWVPRALASAGLIEAGWAVAIAAFWTYGPAIAAVAAAATVGGRAGLRELGSRLVRWRVGWVWYAVVLGGPLPRGNGRTPLPTRPGVGHS